MSQEPITDNLALARDRLEALAESMDWRNHDPEMATAIRTVLAEPNQEIKPFLREVAMTLRILQQRLDDLTGRLERLEQDRASSPGWYMDEGE